ncbi:PTS transporter subunit EIIC [Holdemanella biformis]|uniref:PTS transporter subunit EIIC n=1 Tax=Holdemanella biformis TaxID=1735 RepID=UPI0022E1896E|nr:PTS transporter subunit EIIC [Holdemanella biformis]
MSNYSKNAEDIIKYIGEGKNIEEVKHCFTRLRFKVKDNSKVNVEMLEKIPCVVRVMKTMGQIQVVVGNEIDEVYKAVEKYLEGTSIDVSKLEEPVETKEEKGIKYYGSQILNAISQTISPILMGMVVAGLFKAILTILTLTNIVSTDSQTYTLLNLMGDSFFYFMPVLVAYSASKYFKCNTVLSLMLAGILLHPDFINLVNNGESISLFGLPVHAISYSSSLLPVLFTVWVQSKLEKLVSKTFFTKLGMLSLFPTFLIMAPLTLVVTGPFGSIVGELIANAMLVIYNKYAVLGVFAICFLMPLFIWTGSHWVFMPVALSNMTNLGFDPFLWLGFTAWNFSQLAVSTAIMLKTKDKDLKQIAGSAAFSIATAGISEPCAYGLTLKYKRPIIPSFIGCAVGGLFFGIFKVKVFQMINVSLLSLPQFLDPAGGNNFMLAIIGIVLVFTVTFVLTWFFGFDDKKDLGK